MADACYAASRRMRAGQHAAPGTGVAAGLISLTVARAVAASSYASSTPKERVRTMGTLASSYLKAAAQTSRGTTIVVDEVPFKRRKGCVAIHAAGGTAPGPGIGASKLLKASVTPLVTILLTEPLSDGDTLSAVLHVKDNHHTTSNYPHADQAPTLDGPVVVPPNSVTVHP